MITMIACVSQRGGSNKSGKNPWFNREYVFSIEDYLRRSPNSKVIADTETIDRLKDSFLTDAFYRHKTCDSISKKDLIELSANGDNIIILGGKENFENFISITDLIKLTKFSDDYYPDFIFPDIPNTFKRVTFDVWNDRIEMDLENHADK